MKYQEVRFQKEIRERKERLAHIENFCNASWEAWNGIKGKVEKTVRKYGMKCEWDDSNAFYTESPFDGKLQFRICFDTNLEVLSPTRSANLKKALRAIHPDFYFSGTGRTYMDAGISEK